MVKAMLGVGGAAVGGAAWAQLYGAPQCPGAWEGWGVQQAGWGGPQEVIAGAGSKRGK